MNSITIIFPHQLFENNPAVQPGRKIILVEEYLFFRQYNFHKQKIAYHRASMKFYQQNLEEQNIEVEYIESWVDLSDVRRLIPKLCERGINELHFVELTDDWLTKRINRSAKQAGINTVIYDSPMFLNPATEFEDFFQSDKKLLQTDFYIAQRRKRNLLIDEKSKPVGGKWTYDSENRLKYPKNRVAPMVKFPALNSFYDEAFEYMNEYFPDNPGILNCDFVYPSTFEESNDWLNQFHKKRFAEFGPYEDALVRDEHILHHSLLTPMLNTGLLTPEQVLSRTLDFAKNRSIPLNSLEGFIRQLIGWREFIRGMYLYNGVEQRTNNFWGFNRKIPDAFYTGTTGIDPVDSVIDKVLKTGYAHHIERLMVLGNFMLLCEFDPDEVYRWFMELFIDAYDWVMVPNVYGMSQFADGGLMATKPYISGSNYLMKMSDYKKGDWQQVWDGLFWRFMHLHREFFLQNPRLGMLVRTFDKMPAEKQKLHIDNAELFLSTL